ncbi:MAG: RluA family pseudouridine synthase [Spirochaetia bacterium]|nr:RluA family pseudouridine synthase [Spirochaetia bacterium]
MQEIVKNQIFVKENESGMRLDKMMSIRFPVIGREEWRKRILEGSVLLDSKKARPSRILKKDEPIEFFYQKKEEPDVDFRVKILYEDESLLIFDKPGNLPVHPSGVYYRNTLHEYLKILYGIRFTPRPAHRLDRETSGILITCKTRESASVLQKDFAVRSIYKEYSVIVEGTFPEYINAEGILIQDSKSEVRKKRRYLNEGRPEDHKNAETARSEFYLEKQYGELSLLRAVIHTGRMHQIRATLLGLGFPVVGDKLYGVNDTFYIKMIEGILTEEDLKLLRIRRTALHCSKMEFKHPVSGKKFCIESNLPDDLKNFLEKLE